MLSLLEVPVISRGTVHATVTRTKMGLQNFSFFLVWFLVGWLCTLTSSGLVSTGGSSSSRRYSQVFSVNEEDNLTHFVGGSEEASSENEIFESRVAGGALKSNQDHIPIVYWHGMGMYIYFRELSCSK